MALVRDSDTSLWLHNKLGTSNDLWSGGSICSQLNQDVLRNVKECFIDLQAHVKLKLLLSFLHILRRNVEEWRTELEEILELALADSDQWVSMLAEILKTYPATGTLNLEMEENAKIFTDLVTDLKKLVKKHSDLGMLPLECLYLNRNALNAVIGHQPQPVKHFTLKRKPKSAALRAELLLKSADAASNLKRNAATSVPIRSRGLIKKMEDATPLKGLPSRSPGAGFRSPPSGINRLGAASALARPMARTPAGRKDGGIKLLDITEQPIGYGREAKRRKKAAETEVAEQQKKEKDAAAASGAAASATPDYAAGLVISSQLASPATPLAPTTGPSYVPSSSATSLLPTASAGGTTTLPTSAISSATAQARENFQQSLQAQVRPHVVTTTITIPTVTTTTIVVTQQPTVQTVQPQTPQPQVPQSPLQPQPQVIVPAAQIQPTQAVLVQQVNSQQAPVQTTTQIQVQQPQKKGLSLTKEQIQEAQEMFRISNRVTRPEKALILGFMAGSRENPCPHLGSVVTIRLSEDQEVVQQDGNSVTMVVETHFQMNYNNGEWRRIKKYRKVDE